MRIDESAHPPKGWTKWAIPINIHTNSNAVGSLNGTFQNIAAAITTTITFSYWKPDVTCAGWINQYCRQIGVHFFAQPLRCRVWKWGLDGVWQLIPTSQWNWERKTTFCTSVCTNVSGTLSVASRNIIHFRLTPERFRLDICVQIRVIMYTQRNEDDVDDSSDENFPPLFGRQPREFSKKLSNLDSTSHSLQQQSPEEKTEKHFCNWISFWRIKKKEKMKKWRNVVALFL